MAERAVTISVSYPVVAGEEAEFEAWSRLRLAESADRPGYLGGQVLAPPTPGPDWFIVHRFENERAASRWEAWFRESAGWQQAGDIEWKVEGGEPAPAGRPAPGARPPNGRVPAPRTADPRVPDPRAPGRPAARQPTNGRPPAPVDARARPAAPRPGGADAAPRNGRPRTAEPERPGSTGPNAYSRRGGGAPASGTPPRAATPVSAPAPPRQAGPPSAEGRRYEPSRPTPADTPSPARPAAAPAGGAEPPRAAPLVLTAAVVVLFTAVFETVIGPVLAGGSVLLRIILLSIVITLGVYAVQPPGLRRWLANLLVPVAVRNRREAEGRADSDAGS